MELEVPVIWISFYQFHSIDIQWGNLQYHLDGSFFWIQGVFIECIAHCSTLWLFIKWI